ncbi:MAG: hypothetical protein MUF75_01445 [Bacteroidia bacterium]|jgi:hypothetical protein|nr:hypothetical protein [Bacteroidia bacterium]
MKKTFFLLLVGLLFFTCKKKDQGKIEAEKKLFAEGGDWYVYKMEVNGADSTLLYFPKSITHVKTKLYNFKPEEERETGTKYYPPSVYTYDHMANFELSEDGLKFSTTGCWQTCPREASYNTGYFNNLGIIGQPHTLYLPSEKKSRGAEITWNIDKLTTEEFVMSCIMSKNYRLSFIRAKALSY